MTARLQIKSSKGLAKLAGTKAAKKRPKKVQPDLEGLFRKLFERLACENAIQPQAQFVFHETRKWRFDFAWPGEIKRRTDGRLVRPEISCERSE